MLVTLVKGKVMMIRCFGYGNDDENDGGKVFGNSGDE